MNKDSANLLQSINLGRRDLLTAALFGAGSIIIGATPAYAEPDDRSRDFEVKQRGLDGDREWVHLQLAADGKGEPVPLTITGKGRTEGTITVSSSTGFAAVATRAEAANGERSVECAVESGSGTVWVTPKRVGSAGVRADRLVIESGSGRREIDVWVEPEGGKWGGKTDSDKPIEIKICAIHAATLHREGAEAEVAMFSIGRDLDGDGDYIPDRDQDGKIRPGQYRIDIYAMDHMEGRALALDNYSTIDRPMMEMPRDIFCAGQAQTPDGKLMVAGGHITLNDKNHDADMIHLYDPAVPKGENAWKRLGEKMTVARWYPTVTALPDGQMLITSGSRTLPKQDATDHDEKKGYFNLINNDYLIVDPVKGTMIQPKGGLIDQAKLDALNKKYLDSKPIPGKGHDVREGLQQLATYPQIFVLPGKDGATVVAMAESNRAWLYTYQDKNLKRTDELYPMNTKGSRSYPHYGSMVLLPFGPGATPRILAVGGQNEDMVEHRRIVGPTEEIPATNTAEIFEIDTENLSGEWKWTGKMARPRVLCDATLLADGQVMVTGGSTMGWGDVNDDKGVLETELFDPAAAKPEFRPAAKSTAARRYHSTAVLLPDGTMLKAGSTGGFGTYKEKTQHRFIGNYTGERYFPAYLYRGPRPVIGAVAPDDMKKPLVAGDKITVDVKGQGLNDKAKIALIRPGSTTHGNNMDQRYVWLDSSIEAVNPDDPGVARFEATVPDNPAAVPPGKYMLVVVSDMGIPSVAHWVKVGIPRR